MTGPRDGALEIVRRFGWYVFRVNVSHNEGVCNGGTRSCKTVRPLDEHWKESSSNDPDEVASWSWTGVNAYGIDCGKSGLLVVDEDPGAEWPFHDSLVIQTGRGRHYLYNDLIGLGNRSHLGPWGVDVRGVGGFAIGPGSYHPHGEYFIAEDIEVADPPPELVEALRKPPPPEVGLLAGPLDALEALPRLAGVYRRMSEAEEGTRNDTLNKMAGLAAGIWVRLDEADQTGELSEERIKQHLLDAVPDDGDPVKSRGTIDSGWGYGVEHPVADDMETLQHTIFDATPTLSHIRQAAHSRLLGSGGVLCCVLGRVLLEAPIGVDIPSVIGSAAPLNLGFAFVGQSGSGKSSSVAVAGEILGLNQDFMEIGPGSGEGLIDSFIEEVRETDPNDPDKTVKVKRLVDPPSRLLNVDEVGRMGAIKGREGSTLFSMVRTALTGGSLKTANATAGGRQRSIDGGEYRLIVFAGVQPGLSDVLLDDVNAGTPQRFVWVSMVDKTVPGTDVPWPGELDWDSLYLEFLQEIHIPEFVHEEVKEARLNVVQHGGDPLRGHLLLTKMKVAIALALLHQENAVTQQWWALAGMIIEWSLKEQVRCRAFLSEEKARRDAAMGKSAGRQEVEKSRAVREALVSSTADRVVSLLEGSGGMPLRQLRQRLSAAQRDVLEDVLKILDLPVETGENGRKWVGVKVGEGG